MNWKKRSAAKTVNEAIEASSGCSANDLLNPITGTPEEIGGLQKVAKLISEATSSGVRITIMGDYDADGVTSSAILYLLLTRLGATTDIRLPHRMSEGYGLSPAIVDEIIEKNPKGLLITVDNGISAYDAVKHAKDSGMTVAILDHHLASGKLPLADAIVDQHIDEIAAADGQEIGFRDYCGAGLAYKLAEYMISDKSTASSLFLKKLSALAAVGTVADVVPIQGDNRIIVNDGLDAINHGDVTCGLKSIIQAFNLEKVNSMDIGFKIAPALNASGRLSDDGARLPCAILAADKQLVLNHAMKLVDINKKRKEMVEEQFTRIELTLPSPPPMPIVIFDEHVHEGIAGIIAGKLSEKYGVPSFVLTKAENGDWKGSARTAGDTNIKERMDLCTDAMIGYGGHAGAAGLRIAAGKEEQFKNLVAKAFIGADRVDTSALWYDLEVDEAEVVSTYDEIQKFQPFGEGCKEPVVRINHCHLIQNKNGRYVFEMGPLKNHAKFSCTGFVVVAFSQAQKYKELGEPEVIDAVGHISLNESKWGTVIQLIADDIAVSVMN